MKAVKSLLVRLRIWRLNRRADALLRAHRRSRRSASAQKARASRLLFASSETLGRAERQWCTSMELRRRATRLQRGVA